MRRRRNPQEVFSLSFLDVITSTGGLFLFLVLIFIAAIFLGTDSDLKKEIRLLWAKVNELNLKIKGNEETLNLWKTKTDSVGYYESKVKVKSLFKAKVDSLESKYKAFQDSIKYLEKFSVDLGERLVGITSNIPQAARIARLRPSFDLKTKNAGWNILVVVKDDSVYSLTRMGDSTQFRWNGLSECRIRHGTGEPLNKALSKDSLFERKLTGETLVLVQLHDDSIDSYPILRDYLLSKNKKISLETEVGEPLVTFSSTGWSPPPIY